MADRDRDRDIRSAADEATRARDRSIDADDAAASARKAGNEISLGVDETNALRAKLGLKPLTAGNDYAAREARQVENFEALRAKEAAERKEREEREQREAEAIREKATVVVGKTLGDEDSDDDDDLMDPAKFIAGLAKGGK